MLHELLGRFGSIEVFARCALNKFPDIKKILKKKKRAEKRPLDVEAWETYKKNVEQEVGENQIVLIHSSLDGLASMGVTAQNVLDFLLELVDRGNTIVLPAFPVTNLKEPTPKSVPYDPQKTLCWTGMLPNLFIGTEGVERSVYPFNSLAAIGPKAQEMMRANEQSVRVYDENSAWAFCVKNHAKILFIGVSAASANTIGIHMVPDVMGDEWPIADWYEDKQYAVRVDGEIAFKKVSVQKAMWYKYCMEYATSMRLVKSGVLKEKVLGESYFGIVLDASTMVNVLIEYCKAGKLMYKIPRKYYKARRK